jgi:hypothetical protein
MDRIKPLRDWGNLYLGAKVVLMRLEVTARLPYVDTGTLDGLFPLFLVELKFVQLIHSEGQRSAGASRLPWNLPSALRMQFPSRLASYDDRFECLSQHF